jgi:hypothetical protein
MVEFIIGLALFAVLIIVMRLFGAWMLRINDVIDIQREMLQELRRLNNRQD